jgi:hypothetical protein
MLGEPEKQFSLTRAAHEYLRGRKKQFPISHFFVWAICSAVPGFTLALLLNRKIDPQFGRKAS